ncbi:MAG: ATP-binding protein [bacterium]|nr:ATP-binding protein [bacterium]
MRFWKQLLAILCALILTLSPYSILCQNNKDSLLARVQQVEDPNQKFQIYLKLLKNSSPKEAAKYFKQIDGLLEKIESDSLLMTYYNRKGIFYGQISNDSSFIMFNKALDIALERNDSTSISSTYNGLGNVSRRNGELDKSLEYFINAQKFSSTSTNLLWLGDLEANIAGAYYGMRDYDNCLKHSRKSLEYYKKDGTSWNLSYGYTILGIVFKDMGNYDSAVHYNEKALTFLAESQDTIQLIYSYMTQANLLEKNKDILKSLEYVDLIIDLATEVQSFEPLLEIYNVKARLFVQQGNYKEAESFAKKVIKLGKEKSLPTPTIKAYEILSLVYSRQGKPELAFRQIEISTETRDSIRNADVGEKMAELDLKYETEKKEAEITRLALDNERQSNQRNILIFSLGILLLIIVFVSFIIINKNRANKSLSEKNEVISNALEEREILLKEIHHRVKNNLQIISSLLNLQSEEVTDPSAIEAVKEGQNRVKSMALIHQKLYMNNNLAGIKIKEYLETLTSSLMSSYTDLAQDIKIENKVEDISLDVDTSIPLALILNELITNSIKYGFPESKKTGVIEITLQKKEEQLFLEVKDNGVGMNADNKESENSTSFGLRLVRSLCRKLKADLSFDYSNGTSIQLSINRFKLA